ncbi:MULTISPECIES: helix-turn-helix domain-containing protein [Clostridium]|uniref:helix-turn-helix domain-containing protein n=1 Tax=Clostridium TaxID=1485 RepID=UPI000826776F|nr:MULTISPECIES: helix-turn-helix transcriptional regulator [Clostridium]PJI10209.1 XRE family transcriptional regulator [Clostridium sp. CT7]
MDNKLVKLHNETFGEYIKRIRIIRGYSQRTLADIAGLSNTTISRIENNSIESSDSSTIVKLANGLNIAKEQLLIYSGYLDEKESLKFKTIQDYILVGMKNLGWINSCQDINEETLTYVEFLLKRYGKK